MIRLLLAPRLPVGKLCLPALLWSSLLTGEGAKLYDGEKAWYSIIHQVHSGTYLWTSRVAMYIPATTTGRKIKKRRVLGLLRGKLRHFLILFLKSCYFACCSPCSTCSSKRTYRKSPAFFSVVLIVHSPPRQDSLYRPLGFNCHFVKELAGSLKVFLEGSGVLNR
jgi:hypothetical protein